MEDFYFLCSGTVKLVRESSEGKQTIVDILGPCDWFGEFSFAEGATHSVTAEVVASAKINAVSQRELAAVLRDEPNLLFEMVERLNISLRESRARNAEFAHLPVRLRALHLLTSLFDRHGKHVNGHWELGVPLARAEIADMLGTTPETAIRTLGRLQREGLIQLGRRSIAVVDMVALKELSEQESLGIFDGKDSVRNEGVNGE